MKQEESIVVCFYGKIQHDYSNGKDLVVLPEGRSNGDNMYPFGKKIKITIEYIQEEIKGSKCK